MPRPKKETAAEPKKRSRTGCWPCKARKVKCGEEKPACTNCTKSGEQCDYSIRLNWGGRSRKDKDGTPTDGGFTFVSSPTAGSHPRPASGHEHVFSAQHIAAAPAQRPPSSHPMDLPTPEATPGGELGPLDPQLRLGQQPRQYQPNHGMPNVPPYTPTLTSYPSIGETSPADSSNTNDEFRWSPQHSAKRVKLSPTRSILQPSPVFAVPQYPAPVVPSPGSKQPH
jgi:hypothetical protein